MNKAGRKSEFKYQSEKRGKELMRDIEYALIASRDVKTAGSGSLQTSGARKFGGYQSWVPTVNAVDDAGTAGTITGGAGSTIYQVPVADIYANTGATGTFSLSLSMLMM